MVEKRALMRLKFLLLVCVAAAMVATGCGAFQVEAGFKQPAELTATAEAKVARPSPTPRPQLGKIAFVKGGDVWVKELPDGEARRLTQDCHNDAPLWSPSGEWLAFRKNMGTGGLYQLWLMQATGANARSIGIVRSGLGQQMAWSPFENSLAYVSRNGLYVTETDGSAARELVAPPGRDGAGVMSLAWSPDGQWLAFEKRELEGEPQKLKEGQAPPRPTSHGLWRIKPDGSGMEEVYLSPDPVQTQSYLAGWAPDGQSLLFWQGMLMSGSMMADGAPLMRVPVAGGTPAQITKTLARRDFLAWAPDGQKLALVDGTYRSTWFRKAIAVANLSGGLEVLSDAGRADLFPAFSPDGRWIAFTGAPAVETDGGNEARQASAQRRIWVMAADGSGKRQLTGDPAFHDERPRWSADGSFILFARSGGEQAQLWLMRADGSDQRQVVDEMTPRPDWFGYYGYVDWGQLYDWWRGSPGQAIPKGTGNDAPVPTSSTTGANRESQAAASPPPVVASRESSQATQTPGPAGERTVLHKKVRGVPGELDSTVYQGSTNESWLDTATGEGRYEDRVEKPLLHTVAIYDRETILRLDILRKVFERGPSPYRRDTDVALFGERGYRQKLELGDYELVGRGEVGGRPALKVRESLGAVEGPSSNNYRGLWLDASTYLPLQSFVCETDPERGEPVRCRTSVIDAEWVSRSSLPANLFDQTVPEGFEPGSVVKG